MLTLWDLLPAPMRRLIAPAPARVVTPPRKSSRPPTSAHASATKSGPKSVAGPMQQKYDLMVRDLLHRHGLKIRKWRTSMSGIARETTFRDGSVLRTIESPRPRGPMSCAIFLHEVGHHVIGFNVYKPRCLEEYHAWAFALRTMEEMGFNVTDSVRRRMHRSLHYALAKARRRGLRAIPPELEPFVEKPR